MPSGRGSASAGSPAPNSIAASHSPSDKDLAGVLTSCCFRDDCPDRTLVTKAVASYGWCERPRHALLADRHRPMTRAFVVEIDMSPLGCGLCRLPEALTTAAFQACEPGPVITQNILAHLLYLASCRSQFAAIQTSAGPSLMDADFFKLSCEGLGEPVTDSECERVHAQLAGTSGGVSFQAFVVFVLRRRTNPQGTNSWGINGQVNGISELTPAGVTVQKRRRGVATRVRVNGLGTVFGLGLDIGTQLFSDHPYAAIETPASFKSANFLALPVHDVEVERTDYVTFVPLVELRIFVFFQQRECLPAWLQRDFRRTDLVAAGAASGLPDLELHVWERRTTAQAETVVKLGSAQFTPEEWSARPDAVPIVNHNYAVAVLPSKAKRFRDPPAVADKPTQVTAIHPPKPSARPRSPNPRGFGSSIATRTGSPSHRQPSPGRPDKNQTRAVSPLPRVATLAAQPGSPGRRRHGSPAESTPSGFGSSSHRDTGSFISTERRPIPASGNERTRSTKVRPPPRVYGLSPTRGGDHPWTRERREAARSSTPAGFGSSIPRDSGFGSSSSRANTNGAVSPSTSFTSVTSRASSASHVSRSGSPRQGTRSSSRTRAGSAKEALHSHVHSPSAQKNTLLELVGACALARFKEDNEWHEVTIASVNGGSRIVVEDSTYYKHVVAHTDLIFRKPSQPSRGQDRSWDRSNQSNFAADTAVSRFRDATLAGDRSPRMSNSLKAEIIRCGGISNCDLAGPRVGQAIGDAGMQLLAKVLPNNKSIKDINLEHNDLRPQSIAAFSDVLRRGQYHKLESINLSGNGQITDESEGTGLQSLLGPGVLNHTGVVSLDLSSTGIGPATVGALVEYLVGSGTLQNLNLSGNSLQSMGMWNLVDGLTRRSFLTSLNLRSTSLGDGGARAIGLSLSSTATKLLRLDIADNNITDVGFAAVVAGMAHNASLQELAVFHNRIGNSSAKKAAVCLAATSTVCTLVKLDLRWNPISDSSILASIEDGLVRNRLEKTVVPTSPVAVQRDNATAPRQIVAEVASKPASQYLAGSSIDRADSTAGAITAGAIVASPIDSTDSAAVLAFLEELWKGGVLTEEVYLSRRRVITESMDTSAKPGPAVKVDGIWEVHGSTSDGRPVQESVYLIQDSDGNITGGHSRVAGPSTDNLLTDQVDGFDIHDGKFDGNSIHFTQTYSDGETTRWNARLLLPTDRSMDTAMAATDKEQVELNLVDGQWIGTHFNGSFSAVRTALLEVPNRDGTQLNASTGQMNAGVAEQALHASASRGQVHRRAMMAFRGQTDQIRRKDNMKIGTAVMLVGSADVAGQPHREPTEACGGGHFVQRWMALSPAEDRHKILFGKTPSTLVKVHCLSPSFHRPCTAFHRGSAAGRTGRRAAGRRRRLPRPVSQRRGRRGRAVGHALRCRAAGFGHWTAAQPATRPLLRNQAPLWSTAGLPSPAR